MVGSVKLMKIPVTPSGREPESIRLVQECLNNLRHRVHLITRHRLKILMNLTFMGSCIVIIILIYIQQDTTLHSLFYLETALHVSGGTSTHLQDCKQLYLQHLVLVTP